jgi:quaternary ammonium compound-resistance protein SugE
MAWVVLVVSGVLETVWAAALSRSAGLTARPAAVFAVALVLSMAGLAYALRTIRSARATPCGSASAPWAPRSTAWPCWVRR